MGRWSTLLIRGRHQSKLAVISAYRVCNQNASQAGGRTAYMQQWHVLRTQQPHRAPDPRRQFFTDLQREIQRLISEEYEVVLMLDANESMYDPNSQLLRFVQDCKLTDLHLLRHSAIHAHPPGTYQRGNKRLDYIFGTHLISHCTARAGISAYHELFSSDHRGLYVDLHMQQFFGGKPTPLATPATRLLHSHRIAHALQYRKHVLEYVIQHNMVARSERLEQMANDDPHNPQIPSRLNGLVEDLTRGMLSAEQKCGAHHSHPWSPTLVNARRRVRYWRIWISELRTGRSFANERAQLASEAQWEPPSLSLPTSRAIVLRHLKQAKHYLAECERKAVLLREEFLEERAEYWAAVLHHKKAAVLAGLLGMESVQRVFYRFRTMLKKHQSGGGLASLKVPKIDPTTGQATGDYEWLHDPDHMGPRLIERNLTHFSQARGPFTTGPVLDCLGRNACHGLEGIDRALALPDVSPATKALLDQLQGPHLPLISNTITGHDLSQKFQRWRESTSTSPSGVHLGHYKCLLLLDPPKQERIEGIPPPTGGPTPAQPVAERAAPDRSIEDQFLTHDDALAMSAPAENSCSFIFDIMGRALTTSFKTGQVANRWLTVHNTMLEKDPGDPKIDRLRVIHLFDGLWNAGLGILWSRRLMPHCEAHGALHEGQWGSRQGKKAIDCVCLKQFTYEIATFSRTDLVTFDNDAKSCYDRIVMAYALACCMHLGLPEMTAVAFGKFLDEAKYHVKTVLGVSDSHYSHGDDGNDLHGPGQGSQPGPCLWAIECSQIMDALTKHFKGVDLCAPDRELQIAQALQGFVDDVANASAKFQETLDYFTHNPYAEAKAQQFLFQLVQEATAMAQWWETLLWHSGGQLEFRKCFLYVLHWTFDTTGLPRPASVQQLQDMGISVSLTNSDDTTTTELRHLDCSVATRTLGCMVAPNGSSTTEINHLIKKGWRLGVALASTKISRRAARTFYSSIFLPSLTYSLPSTHLRYKDCQRIHRASTGYLLNALGLPRTFPLALSFAPTEVGGLGLTHFWVEQGCQHLHSILLPTLRGPPNILRNTLVILLKWGHMSSGIMFHPFQDVDPHLLYLPDGWFKTTRDFLIASDARLELREDEFPAHRPYRVADSNLMEEACRGPWKKSDLVHINNCRMYLKVRFLSEVCTLLGDRLYIPCLDGTASTISQPDKELWPIQQCPGKAQWALFRRFLRTTYCKHGRTDILRDRLEKWLPQATEKLWPAYFEFETDHILLRGTGKNFLRYPTLPARARSALYDRTIVTVKATPLTELPPNCFPTRVDWPRRLCAIPPALDYIYEFIPSAAPNGLLESFTHRWPVFHRHVDFLPNSDGLQHLFTTLNQPFRLPSMHCVCDGGCRTPLGSYGWVIGNDQEVWLKAHGPVLGWPMSSFRAEAWSIWCLLCFLQHATSHYGFVGNPIQKWVLHTDSLSFIQRFNELRSYGELWYSSVYTRNDIDLFIEIFAVLRRFPYYIEFEHVKGHQDAEVSFNFLPRLAQLNVLADEMATVALDRQKPGPRPWFPMLPHSKVRLTTQAYGPHNGDELKVLRKIVPGKNLARYFQHKFQWTDQTHECIDWISFEQACHTASISQTFLAKLFAGWLPTNVRLAKYEPMPPCCPCCPLDETQDHLYRCRSADQWRSSFLTELKERLTTLYTEPTLQTHMLQCFEQLLHTPPKIEVDESLDGDLTDIQPILVFRGFIPKGWRIQQEHYLEANPHIMQQKRPPPPWGPTMITHLWFARSTLWRQRNQRVHAQTHEGSPHTRRQMENMVHQLYRAGEQLLYDDRTPFAQPLEQRLATSSTAELQDWITTIGPVVARGQKRQASQTRLHTSDIRTHFPVHRQGRPTTRPPHPDHSGQVTQRQRDLREFFPFQRQSASHSTANTTGDNNHPS